MLVIQLEILPFEKRSPVSERTNQRFKASPFKYTRFSIIQEQLENHSQMEHKLFYKLDK